MSQATRRSPRNTNNIYRSNFLSTLCLFMCFFLVGGEVRIKEEFYACKKQDLDEMTIVNLNSCNKFKDSIENLTWSKIMQDGRKILKVAVIRKHS
jgi:hypothetical protein